MLVSANPVALAATGTFAVSYNASRWISDKTGWGQASGRAGATVANAIMGDDPGAFRTGAGFAAGFVVSAGGTLIVEPVAAAGTKLGQVATWVFDNVTEPVRLPF